MRSGDYEQLENSFTHIMIRQAVIVAMQSSGRWTTTLIVYYAARP